MSTHKATLYHISLPLTTSTHFSQEDQARKKQQSTMCPMRVFLVFFSAILAGYLTWKSVQTYVDTEDMVSSDDLSPNQQQSSIIKMGQNALYGFVDMASGKYLWRNLRQMTADGKNKSN
ncbi:hypothetical protein HanPI659440_Chr14g0549511 [Helianthus annuus]|nr:hypothetical protein HanPI659440_Chr14g0549511 [Helianthus annuus]